MFKLPGNLTTCPLSSTNQLITHYKVNKEQKRIYIHQQVTIKLLLRKM